MKKEKIISFFIFSIFCIPIADIGISIITYGSVYLDFISHNVWNSIPPMNIVNNKINSLLRFFLFFIIYFLVAILTIFTSNDIVILTFTPFIFFAFLYKTKTKCAILWEKHI